jgi:alginate O-acetyltransferase complex protein AlgI
MLQTMVTIGVSYYTFQAISYLIDIRLGLLKPEHHLGYYALSLAFFPKLLQGPIERGGDLLPQLQDSKPFDYLAARSGLLLVAWGLFQKVVIADRLGMYVDTVYNDLRSYQGASLLLATYGYAGQIYFDFAGYTSMAIGSARMFGIALTPNFNQPYLATSIADFWRRWHISFSRWILDYIFKPLQLGWRNWGTAGTSLALLITFLVSGLWHGASWGFIVWGLLHGCYMACSVWYRPWQKKLHHWLGISKTPLLKFWQIGITFHLVCLAWVFFRANSLSDAFYVLQHLWPLQTEALRGFMMIKGDRELYITLLLLGGLMTAVLFPPFKHGIAAQFNGRWRWAGYYLLVLIIFVCGIFHQGAFLYGRF